MKKTILIAILVCCFFCLLAVCAKDENSRIVDAVKEKIADAEKQLQAQLDEIKEKEWPAQDAYVRLQAFLDGPEGKEFRPFYGGAWLNDTKQLVINVKGDDKEAASAFLKAADFLNARISSCQFSRDELQEVFNILDIRSQKDPFSGLSSFGISETKNCIQIVLSTNNEDLRKAFVGWAGDMDASIFEFSEGQPPIPAV